ncbi:MAG: LLM class flavin-dependent oxidoreductase [Micropepsaceae bacterium]
MTAARTPPDIFWLIPSSGDTRQFGRPETDRAPTPAYLASVAMAVDRMGYTGALLPTGPHCADPWITAAALALHTERMKLLVATRPGLVAPAESVRQAAALDRLSRGRALLNVVTGGSTKALSADGLFLDHDQRYVQTAEFMEIWRRLSDGETVSFEGQYLKIEKGRLLFPFVQRPPIYFGGSSEIARDIAARHADVYLSWGEPAAQLADVFSDVRTRAAALGRTVRFGVRLHIVVREREEDAWKAAEDLIRHVPDAEIAAFQERLARSEAVGQARLNALHGGRRDSLVVGPNLWAGIGLVRTGAGTALVGTPDQVAARLQEYADIGVDTLIASGYPHLEEAYRVAELLFPKLGIDNAADDGLPRSNVTASFIMPQSAGKTARAS